MNQAELLDLLGPIDIYLFDQIMKGRFNPDHPLLDAGCGSGRNLTFFLRAGFDVHAVDVTPEAVDQTRRLAAGLAPRLADDRFRAARIEALPFESGRFGAVLSIAVLHFARDESHFDAMLNEMWRVLRPGGVLFARLASSIGIESLIRPLGDGRFDLPDGSERFLVDQELLLGRTAALDGRLLEPLKTVNVQNQRCMTTWVLRKLGS